MASTTHHKSHKDSKRMQPQTSKNGGATPVKGAPSPAATSKAVPNPVSVFRAEEGSGTVPAPDAAVEAAPALSPEERRRVFAEAIAAEKAIEAAEQAVKEARLACSVKVKAVIDGMGGKHGPWRYNGELLRARVRNDLAYFLRPDDLDVTDI